MSSPDVAASSSSSLSSIRPSEARRRALNEELSIPMVSNFFPIERYYDAADKVYESFQESFLKGDSNLDDAYVYGKRYCLFLVDAIPNHNYFGAPKYKFLTTKHKRQLEQVLNQLAMVADAMDRQELERERKRAEEVAFREAQNWQEVQLRAQKIISNNNNNNNNSMDPNNSSNNNNTATNIEASAFHKLNLLRNATTTTTTTPTHRVRKNSNNNNEQGELGGITKRDPSGEDQTRSEEYYDTHRIHSSSRYSLNDSEEEQEEKKMMNGRLPPPVPPPTISQDVTLPPPPSYNDVATQRSARYHGTFWAPPSQDQQQQRVNNISQPPPPQSLKPRIIPIRQFKLENQRAYLSAQQQNRIQIWGIDTWQGKYSASTNGCTVISALVAARHLQRDISDAQIVQVIDGEAGPLLREIRQKLGLGMHAFIIPSDVHDHLVDKHVLKQEYFEGAAGGNVTDPQHLRQFLKLLSVGENGQSLHRKASATFFFHEHVVSIVKVPQSNGSHCFDLIDSLPTWRLGGKTVASRTRCVDIQALEILLQYYTTQKFSESNCDYIDRNVWEDTMADFDPRVFQGFVWSV